MSHILAPQCGNVKKVLRLIKKLSNKMTGLCPRCDTNIASMHIVSAKLSY